MVRNGSNVQLVTESEGKASRVRQAHSILIFQHIYNIVGRVRGVVTLSICFLQ